MLKITRKKKLWTQISKNNWCKGNQYQYNKKGEMTRACAIGYLELYTTDTNTFSVKVFKKVKDHLEKIKGHRGIIRWNDDKKTSFKDVKRVFKDLNI